jgi:hypothetical protein
VQYLLSGGMGLGLEENSREAYAFIANNYKEGDEIFLFGFSRGAYTARSVAGLIGALGVLTKNGMPHFKPIYDLYEKAKTPADWASSLADYISKNKLDGTGWRAPPESTYLEEYFSTFNRSATCLHVPSIMTHSDSLIESMLTPK